jgi:hypothetical protein
MAPTIKPGENVTLDFTACTFATPKRWDVVAFEPPRFTNQTRLMRVVAFPGESVGFGVWIQLLRHAFLKKLLALSFNCFFVHDH